MNNIDYLGLDGNKLRTFLTVLEEVSVSKAALRLGVSQSAVSHTLDKLRQTFEDPLFIREGRGIVPTARARSLREPIESALGNLKSLTHKRNFDPAVENINFTIATNDFPMGLIFPKLLKELHTEGINLRLNFVPSGVPSANLTRATGCQMLITPAPPAGKDIISEQLFQSKMVCFYDSEIRKPPKTWKQYIDSKYAEVKFSDTESSLMVLPSINPSDLNKPTIIVPNFNSLAAFIKGTDLITTQLALMSLGPLKNLASVPLPLKTSPLAVYLVWHQRDNDDPAHRWLRERINETVKSNSSI